MNTRLYPVPVELSEANRLVARWHRHHQPSQGHRFSIGVIDEEGKLHGAAIVGRPVARLAGSPRDVLEVVRLVTDGHKNACSLLYAAAARAGAAMGYRRIQTYILGDETGASLRAAGWTDEGEAGGGQWKHTDGKPRRTDQPTEMKTRWAKQLMSTRPDLVWSDAGHGHVDTTAFDFGDWDESTLRVPNAGAAMFTSTSVTRIAGPAKTAV